MSPPHPHLDHLLPAALAGALSLAGGLVACRDKGDETGGDTLDEVDWFNPAGAEDPAGWRQYRKDATHQGVAPVGAHLSPAMELMWSTEAYAIGDYSASKSSPVVDDTGVYVGFDDGRLLALDRDTGALRWAFETRRYAVELGEDSSEHHGIHGTPAVDDEQVYIGDYSGWLYALDKETGALRWEQKLGGSIGASPVLFQGQIFMAVEFGDPDGKVFIVDAASGEIRWSSPYLGNHPHASVSLDTTRGLAYVGANNGRFFCYDYQTGEQRWTFDMVEGAEIKSTAAVGDGTVWITSWDYRLYALDAETGEERYHVESGARSMSSPSAHDGTVYFGSHDNQLYAVDDDTGLPRWTFDAGGVIISSPTVVPDSGLVAIGSGDRSVYLLRTDTGAVAWSAPLGGIVSSVPLVIGGSLFLSDAAGQVWRWDDAAP
jgi:outer membrane protein assembly factor BamB